MPAGIRVFNFNTLENAQLLQRGIAFRKNKNSFGVIFLHYIADPAKDPATQKGREWLREAVEGMDPLSWSKEMEMDFFAKAGQAIYPQFSQIHVIPPFIIPSDWTVYQGIDGGIRAPCASLWAAVDPYNSIYLFMEYSVSGKEAKEHAIAFKAREKRGKIHVRERVGDPSLFNRSPTDGRSVADIFEDYGISLDASVNDPLPAINIIYSWLAVNSFTKMPRLFIFNNMFHTIREMTEYHWEQSSSLVLAARRNPTEMPEKVNDHLMNCLQYLAHADIRYIKPSSSPYGGIAQCHGFGDYSGDAPRSDVQLPAYLQAEVLMNRMNSRYG